MPPPFWNRICAEPYDAIHDRDPAWLATVERTIPPTGVTEDEALDVQGALWVPESEEYLFEAQWDAREAAAESARRLLARPVTPGPVEGRLAEGVRAAALRRLLESDAPDLPEPRDLARQMTALSDSLGDLNAVYERLQPPVLVELARLAGPAATWDLLHTVLEGEAWRYYGRAVLEWLRRESVERELQPLVTPERLLPLLRHSERAVREWGSRLAGRVRGPEGRGGRWR